MSMLGSFASIQTRSPEGDHRLGLGKLFAATGCACQILWLAVSASSLQSMKPVDFTAAFLYSGLALSGILLIVENSRVVANALSPSVPDTFPRLTRETYKSVCRLLVIGPWQVILQQLVGRLEESGVARCEQIESPAFACEKIECRIDSEMPHVIFASTFLPVITPLDLLIRFKSSERLKHIPFIVCGRGLDQLDIQRLYAEGAVSVMVGVLTDQQTATIERFCASLTYEKKD